MILEQSNFYFRFPGEINDRIDFVHYHPELDPIKQFRASDLSEPFGKSVLTFDYGVTASGKETGTLKFINIQNLRENGEIIDEGINYIDTCPENLQLRENDILISRSRLVGRAARVTKSFEGETFGSYIIRFQLKPESEYLHQFIVKFFNCRFGQEQVTLLKTGASGENINSNQLLDIRLPKIDKEKQSLILAQLKPIELQASSLEMKAEESLVKAENVVVAELGIDIRDYDVQYFFKEGRVSKSDYYYSLTHQTGERFHYLFNHPKLSMLKELQSRYETTSLKNICRGSIRRGVQPKYSESGSIVLKTIDLKNSYIDYDNALHVSKEFVEANQSAQIEKGYILIASTGYVSMGKIDIYDRDEPALISSELLAFTVDDDYDPYFICYYLRSPLGQIQFDKWFSGSSGQIHIYDIEIGQFVIPSNSDKGIKMDEQKRIASLVNDYLNRARECKIKAQEKRQEAKEQFEQSISEVPWF